MRINGLEEFPIGHVMFPVVRGREGGVYLKIRCQAPPEVVKRLDVAEGRVYPRIAMTEVPVGHDERAVIGQQFLYLGKFLGLDTAEVLEGALGHDYIELLSVELYRILDQVRLD